MAEEFAEVREPIECLYCGARQPHFLFVFSDGLVAWCLQCLRVHSYVLDGPEFCRVLSPSPMPLEDAEGGPGAAAGEARL